MSLVNWLFKIARGSADVKAFSSGKPSRVARRSKNKIVGRALARTGFWSRLWR